MERTIEGEMIFKLEHFPTLLTNTEAADIANKILTDYVKTLPEVVCRKDNNLWACDEHKGFARATHSARLIDLKNIETEKG